MQVNPAVWEISGHIVLKRKVDYEAATEESAWKLLAQVSLSHERFEEVKGECLKAASNVAIKPSDTTLQSANQRTGLATGLSAMDSEVVTSTFVSLASGSAKVKNALDAVVPDNMVLGA